MSFREVHVFEIREVLQLWLRGEGQRSIERLASVDRKTVGRYVGPPAACGLVRDGGEAQLSDELSARCASGCVRTAPTATAPPRRR